MQVAPAEPVVAGIPARFSLMADRFLLDTSSLVDSVPVAGHGG